MDDSCPPFTRVAEPASDYLSYGGIRLSAEAVWQADDQRRVIERIERDGILACELRRGSPEQHPVISFLLGLVLASSGYFLAVIILGFLRHDGHLNPRIDAVMLMLFALGVWLIHKSAIAKRYYLYVVTKKGRRKLIFNARSHLGSIRDMADAAAAKYGWHVDEKIG